MDVDKTKLTPEQQQVVKTWETFFNSPAYSLFLQRFQPRLDASVGRLEVVIGEQALGLLQGERQVLNELVNLDAIIEAEIKSYQVAQEADDLEDQESRHSMA